MTNPSGDTKLGKWLLANWAFLLGDLLLLLFAGWVMGQGNWVRERWLVLACGGAVLAGAILLIIPQVLDHRLRMKQLEADLLKAGLEPIKNLESIAQQIALATSQWQSVQEIAEKTTLSIKDIADRMATEANAFAEFLKKANETEKQHLRLEVEKLRRGEGEWLQIVVATLDHIHALHQAGVRSGRPNLIEELSRFQAACRDVARRVGLVPLTAQPGDRFDTVIHQLAQPNGEPPPDAQIEQVIALGYSFQGQLIRQALVTVLAPAQLKIEPDGSTLPETETQPNSTAPINPVETPVERSPLDGEIPPPRKQDLF
jgi:molecular chaperone GrpE (heat shock protein)